MNRPTQDVMEFDEEEGARKPASTGSKSECETESDQLSDRADTPMSTDSSPALSSKGSVVQLSMTATSLLDEDPPIKQKLSLTAKVNKGVVTQSEKTLLALWSSLLNLPEDSIQGQDSFFDLGGDSITAMKLVGDARDHGLALTVADVFRHPSFDSMVASVCAVHILASDSLVSKIENMINTKQVTTKRNDDLYERFSLLAASNVNAFLQTHIVPQVSVFRGGLVDVLPATDFQSLAVTGALLESRWMLNYFYLEGDGPLDVGRLKRACFQLVQALDILRTVFVPSGGRFLQVVLRTLRPAFHVLEANGQPLDDFMAELQRRDVGGVFGEPFVEFSVIKQRQSTRHRIVLRISHAQYDGVCFPKILSALQAAYQGEALPRSPPSFANYLRASAGALTSEHYQHWRQLLAGSSMTEIVRRTGPSYFHRRATSATSIAKAPTTACCLKRTVHLPPVSSITAATIIKAAWAHVLAQVSSSADVVFGHTISGRNATVDGVAGMIGPCLNLVPVRVHFPEQQHSGWTVNDLLHHVQGQQLANMPHEVLGFREIVRHCTTWPAWTSFSTTVQHQNVDRSTSLRLGNLDYRVGAAAPVAHEDFADLEILSQPIESDTDGREDMYEIMLSFAEGGAVPREFAERALDMLCDAAHLFATDPSIALPSSSELLSRRPRELPFDEEVVGSSTEPPSSLLHHLTPARHLRLAEMVTAAWREVLVGLPPSDRQQAPAVTNGIDSTGSTAVAQGMVASLSPRDLVDSNLDTSFFDIGGDIVGLAQLVGLFNRQGFSAPRLLEDMVAHPTVRGHMVLLLASSGGDDGIIFSVPTMVSAPIAAVATPATLNAAEVALEEIQEAAVAAANPEVAQKMRRTDSSSATKALRLVAKKFMRRKNIELAVVSPSAAA